MGILPDLGEGVLEIRWHGRGGQGVVTAGKLLAEAALEAGLFFQAFPDYGPERMGAPIRAFTRLSNGPIYNHSQITNPDVVIVLDGSVLDVANVTAGVGAGGVLLVNSKEAPERVRVRAGWREGRLFTVDASGIARRHLGREVTNTPMLGALAGATGLFDVEQFVEPLRHAFAEMFGEKVVQANIGAMKEAAENVHEASPAIDAPVAYPAPGTNGLKGWRELPAGGLILEAGNAFTYNTGSWRSRQPLVDAESCTDCLFCWLYCPDGSIHVDEGKLVGIDYDHCKGCGVCAVVCPTGVITMVADGQEAVQEVAG